MVDKLAAIIDRFLNDASFKAQLIQQPAVALESYNLSTEETEALHNYLVKKDEDDATTQQSWWHV